MRHDAAVAGRAVEGSGGAPRIRTPSTRAVLAVVLAAEILLLVLAWRTGKPWMTVGLATAPAFFLVAFRAPDVAWALVWMAVPFSMQRLLPGGNAVQFPTEPMIAIALAAWGMRWLMGERPDRRIRRSRLDTPLAVLAGIALLSVVAGPHPMIGVKAWVATAGYAAFGFLYFSRVPSDAGRRERWMRLVVGIGAVLGLYGFLRVLALGVSARIGYGAARPFFPEHGTYSAYLAMLLPLALLLSVGRTGRARWFYASGALSIALGIVFSFTRAAWISLAVVLPLAFGIWIARHRSPRQLWIPALVFLVVLVVLVGSGALDPFSRHAGSVVDPENVSNLERLNRWIAAVEMAKDRPALGVGYGGYAASYPVYRRKLIITEMAHQYMGPHSEPLRLLSETGILGLIAALWLLGAAGALGFTMIRHGSPGTSLIALGLVAGLATYVVHGVFNTYLAVDKVAVPFWSGLGALAGLARERA